MCLNSLVVDRILRISKVEDNRRVRLRATTVCEFPIEVDRAVEAKRAILVDVNVQRLEVGRSVDDTDVAGLHEVIGDDDVLLIGSDFDVVGSDGGLILIGVIKALDVV
jgi:hypothetical protein